ncbi:hypothetical protein EYF80_041002 [Liparis tanakae]|uniref:Uncharacterized protein n=1 Tax=Liparis tanakae TaxID=230148 RepID=A0A4Z2G5G7_9TELE|nr:hypothetical protein EYF80_041002 [Liparis tanakae]
MEPDALRPLRLPLTQSSFPQGFIPSGVPSFRGSFPSEFLPSGVPSFIVTTLRDIRKENELKTRDECRCQRDEDNSSTK